MPLRFEGCSNIRRLHQQWSGFLQVLLPEFTLTKKNGGVLLDVEVREEFHSLANRAGKNEFNEALDQVEAGAKAKLTAELAESTEIRTSCRTDRKLHRGIVIS